MLRRPRQHAPQRAARADLFGAAGELRQEQQHVAFQRQRPAGARQQAHRRIREGGVPAGEGDVVVLLVVRVPAQHHVAEAKAFVERGEELVAVDVLAAQDAVVVEHPDLDVLQSALLDDCTRLRGGAHLFRLHRCNSIFKF